MKKATERELFEFWAKRAGYYLERDRYSGHYIYTETAKAYVEWAAGRAALKRAQRRAGGAR